MRRVSPLTGVNLQAEASCNRDGSTRHTLRSKPLHARGIYGLRRQVNGGKIEKIIQRGNQIKESAPKGV